MKQVSGQPAVCTRTPACRRSPSPLDEKCGRLPGLMGACFRATTVHSRALVHDWHMDGEQGNVKYLLATSGLVKVAIAQCFLRPTSFAEMITDILYLNFSIL